MLETVHQYAHERLAEQKDAGDVHRRHCLYYLALTERAEPELSTSGEAEWLPCLDAEIDNLRAVLNWSLHHGDPGLALRMAGLLCKFWDVSGREAEGLEWINAALDAVNGHAVSSEDRARALRARVFLDWEALYATGAALESARVQAAEALAISRQTGDPATIADALLGLASLEMGERFPQQRRRALVDDALTLAREAGDARTIAFALMHRALALPPHQAQQELEEAASALRAIGATRSLIFLYSDAAYNALKTRHPELAASLLDQAAPVARGLAQPRALIFVRGNQGLAALFTGDLERARDAFNEQLQLCEEHVISDSTAEGLAGLAAIASRRGDPHRTAQLLGAATAQGAIGDADVTEQLEEQFFGPARAAFGERRWNTAQAEGSRLNLQQAIALALTPNPTPG